MTRLLLALATLLAAVAILATPAHAAVVACTGQVCNGTDKPDEITGSPVADDIYGRGNDDQIVEPVTAFYDCGFPTAVTGVLCSDNDVIHGGGGADTIDDGSPGRDRDNIYGGDGPDTIDVTDDPDADVPGEPSFGQDFVDCGGGNDTVYADPEDDVASNCENVIRS